MLPVAQHHIAHIAHAEAVHQDRSDGHSAVHFRLLAVHLQHVAGLQHENILFRNAQILGDLRLRLPVLVLAVDRHRIARLHKAVDQLDLLLTGMSGNMHILKDHIRPLLLQLVDHIGDRLLIARDRVG